MPLYRWLLTGSKVGLLEHVSLKWIGACHKLGYPHPLRERVVASAASGRVRGAPRRPPHPPCGFAARHPLPQGERVTECMALSCVKQNETHSRHAEGLADGLQR